MSKLKVLDLFSGIGGFSYGLEKTGLYETVAFCEVDHKAKLVLQKHWPCVPIFSDVKTLSGYSGHVSETYYKSGNSFGLYDLEMTREVDVIVGGFPCQDISSSGKGVGLEGKRSGLWYEFLRLISLIKPKGVIIENVATLRTKGLDKVLQGLFQIGYDAEWHCIPASYTGAPHERDRVWIIAYPSSLRQQKPWRCLKPFSSEKDVYREADWFVDAFQREELPFVCGRHDGVPNGMDRLKQLGNSVVWPIVQGLGMHLHRNLVDG